MSLEPSHPAVPSMIDIFRCGKSNLKNKKMQRSANALQWRQKYQNSSTYEIILEDKRTFTFKQIGNGEMKGIGTGSIVWPAAHVLAMYMEKRFGNQGLEGARVCDIGSGTGFTGIIGAALGAKEAKLTDQTTVQALLEENIVLCSEQVSPEVIVKFAEFDWDASPAHLSPPFDLILVSDCVLPKLYPIEPLVKAVASLMSDKSIALFSYEHRPFPDFDPRQEFVRLASIYGLQVEKVPIEEHHDYYCSDEIEIWEVTSVSFRCDPLCSLHAQRVLRHAARSGSSSLTMLTWGNVEEVRVQLQLSVPRGGGGGGGENSEQCLAGRAVELCIKQDIHVGIGNYLWPSSVVLSRFLLKHPSLEFLQTISSLGRESTQKSELHPTTASPWVLDIGAGCGLTSIVLGEICDCNVLAVDKASVMDLLNENLQSNCSSYPPSKASGRAVKTRCFDWNSALECSEESIRSILQWSDEHEQPYSSVTEESEADDATHYHYPLMIVLSDCFYQYDAVDPILKLLDAMAGESTFILVANELRTAFDEFLNKMRNQERQWKFEEIALTESDLEIYKGCRGDIASRPSRLLLCFRSGHNKHGSTPK